MKNLSKMIVAMTSQEIAIHTGKDHSNVMRDIRKLIDEVDIELENKCWAPSWRRMCKVLLRNDYWCKGLGQTQPKSDSYQAFKEIKAKRKLELHLKNIDSFSLF